MSENRAGVAPELDPRVERSRRVIMEATLDELCEVGYGNLSIESVARRAGVGKATVYRHWDGKIDLIYDALGTMRSKITPPEGATVRERITGMLKSLAVFVTEDHWAACLPILVDAAERDPAVREFHHQFTTSRRRGLVELIEEGIRNGELPADADPDLAAVMLCSPIFYQRLMTAEPFEPSRVDELVDIVLPRP
jgi:TetR/AcrR family transcriptional regulator, regulator of autoinduction and epiphytic fitness